MYSTRDRAAAVVFEVLLDALDVGLPARPILGRTKDPIEGHRRQALQRISLTRKKLLETVTQAFAGE